MIGLDHLFSRRRPSVARVVPSKKTLWLGRSRSEGKGPIFEQQFQVPAEGRDDMLFGLLRLSPRPVELLANNPPELQIMVRFRCAFPTATIPQVTAFAIGQAGLEVSAQAISDEGFRLSVMTRSIPMAENLQFGWVAQGMSAPSTMGIALRL